MDTLSFSVNNRTCLYVITERRPRCLARMLASVDLSTYIPGYICIVTPDRSIADNFEVAYAASRLRDKNVRVDFVGCSEGSGLSARKNVALQYMQLFNCEFGLAVDDDMVFEFYAIEDMYVALTDNPELFAVGPVVLHENRTGLPLTDETWQETMAFVEDGVWRWGGHRQGVIPQSYEREIVAVQHMAAVFLHRLDDAHQYDEAYDRPIYFLYDSDFLYGKQLAVVRSAVVHHWPTTTGPNLQDQYAGHEGDILANAQYFAQKHGLGEVREFSWVGYIKPEGVK